MLASRFYHPTADINLQRADLTDGFAYYNSDIAIAAFATPTQINNEYLGLIKR
jgi:spermidine synthase